MYTTPLARLLVVFHWVRETAPEDVMARLGSGSLFDKIS
jgi:hypothetical protein